MSPLPKQHDPCSVATTGVKNLWRMLAIWSGLGEKISLLGFGKHGGLASVT